ncbi:protocadherin alpha-11-like [Heterocephalus glaber]|uniref:Protocadherin alpha-11-like n=1 Tax=Heterocephalus glaber TaxID=10181 RepID=A0AAX6TMH7_HETGA|nr:protocadherin alpha-11-like [Heterocephalus glaber]
MDTSLDRESISSYELVVTARDGGSPSLWATATVSMKVADVNDNAPVFAQPEYTVFVKENNLPGSHIFTVCARDADASAECSIHLEVIVDRPLQVFHVEVEVKDINDNSPVFSLKEQRLLISESKQPDSRFPLEGAFDADIEENAVLTYRLSQNEYFSLESPVSSRPTKRLSLILKKPLDREKNAEHKMILTASDGGKPERTGTVQLFVQVLDVNDNDPEFDQLEYKVRLVENAAKEILVIKLNATDRDEGLNGEVTYSLKSIKPSGRPFFTLDGNNGEVRVNGTLDYEENKFYEIEVQATDKGTPPMAGHCIVWVEILDINDNSPQVTVTSLSLPVLEDAQTSTVIALISVSDLDSGVNGQVTCSLTSDVPFKIVSTFKNYYSLVLDSNLDRESVSNYEVVVTAKDGGSPSLWATATVSVEVADVNDNAPVFAQPEYTVFVKENNPPGSHIFTVCARDADAQCSIHLEVIVDRPLQVFHVEVEVKDINDNPPVFPATQKNLLVSETRALDSRFSLEGAWDADVGANSVLTYRLSPNEYFSLEVPTKEEHVKPLELVLKKPLDRELASELLLVLKATDGGKPELSGTVELVITVLDVNDNAPVFDRAIYPVKLLENARNGTLIQPVEK